MALVNIEPEHVQWKMYMVRCGTSKCTIYMAFMVCVDNNNKNLPITHMFLMMYACVSCHAHVHEHT